MCFRLNFSLDFWERYPRGGGLGANVARTVARKRYRRNGFVSVRPHLLEVLHFCKCEKLAVLAVLAVMIPTATNRKLERTALEVAKCSIKTAKPRTAKILDRYTNKHRELHYMRTSIFSGYSGYSGYK